MKAVIGMYRTSTDIVSLEGNYQHVELCLDKVINSGIGYPKYFRTSHKMDKLPTNMEERERIAEEVELQEGDTVVRRARTRVQGTGIKNASACTMIMQLEWDSGVNWWSKIDGHKAA